MDKTVIGLIENITLYGMDNKKKQVLAKIDTGATKSSVDASLAAELNLGPVLTTKVIKSAQGHALRAVVKAKIKLAGKTLTSQMTIADRSNLKYRVLIGQNSLSEGFLIDPSKQEKC